MGQTEISGRCYGKNEEGYAINFACAKYRRIGVVVTDLLDQ
jgi:hypothetical protein